MLQVDGPDTPSLSLWYIFQIRFLIIIIFNECLKTLFADCPTGVMCGIILLLLCSTQVNKLFLILPPCHSDLPTLPLLDPSVIFEFVAKII